MTLVNENPYGKSERNGFCGSNKRRNPGRVSFCFAHPQENRIRTFRLFIFFVLLYSVISGLRPCWGADMRGRIVNNIFWCSGWYGSGFSAGGRGFRPPPFSAPSSVICWGVSNTTDWYVKTRGGSCQIGCERGNCYRIPAWFGFFSFWTRRNCFLRFGPGSAFSLFKVETVRLLTLIVFGLNDSLHWDAVRIYP